MKKGCFAGIGCSGIVLIVLAAFLIINFISGLNYDFDDLTDSSGDYSFDIDTLGNQAIIKSEFQWRFTSSSLGRRNYKLSFNLLEKEVKTALAYLDEVASLSESELNIDPTYRSDQIYYTKLIWHEIYKRVYWQAYDKFDNILKGFYEIFLKEGLNDRDKIYFIISFVQNIKYKRPEGKLDLLPPLGTLASRFGDCDTKALLLYILLEKSGVDCVMFWSFHYKHAMLGVALNLSGNYKSYKGKKYFFIETTYPGWNIGDIDPEMKDLSLWYIDDLDSDKMKIDYKYDYYDKSDTDRFDVNDNYKEDKDEGSGKRDKASPSNR